MSIYKEPPPGMCIVPDSDDLTKVIKCFLKHLRDTCKGRFTPSETERESEKDQRTSEREQRKKSNIKENFRFRSV